MVERFNNNQKNDLAMGAYGRYTGSLDLRIDMAQKGSPDYGLFSGLVVADTLDFRERVTLKGFTDPDLDAAIRALSIQGHMSSGHLNNALRFLFKNRRNMRREYNVKVPRDITSKEEYMDAIGMPYVNTTPHDILAVWHEKRLMKKTPRELMLSVQNYIDNYRNSLVNIANGGNDNRFASQKEADAYLVTSLMSLGVMDSDYWRAISGVKEIGAGTSVTLSRKRLIEQYGIDGFAHDMKSLSQTDVRKELGLDETVSKMETLQRFYNAYLPSFHDMGIVVPGISEQNEDLSNGYIRVFKAPKNAGTSDFMARIWGWFLFGRKGFDGINDGDLEDTLEKVALLSYDGGQDEHIVKDLLKIPKVKTMFDGYSDESKNLIKWAYENPEADFNNIESCSIRYFHMQERRSNGDVFNTLDMQKLFMKNFIRQFRTGTVDPGIPNYTIGFGRAPSRGYFSYALDLAREFNKMGLFPEWSWASKNLKGQEFMYENIPSYS